DASPDQSAEHIQAVESVLKVLDCANKPMILVFNKVDRFRDPLEREILHKRFPDSIIISARTGEGLDVLTARVAERLTKRLIDVEVEMLQSEGKMLAVVATWCVLV